MTITATGDRLEVHLSPAADVDPEGAHASSALPEVQGAGVAEVQASARPTFTITDAAAACSVSRKTITRKLPELAGHGAAKDDDGVWRIPVEALLAVGLHPGRSLPEGATAAMRPVAPPPPAARPTELDTVTIPRDRWDDVRIRLARAEAEATERGMALADARLALRALTAGPVAPARAVSAIGGSAAAPTGLGDANSSTDSSGARVMSTDAEPRRGQHAVIVGPDVASGPVLATVPTPSEAATDRRPTAGLEETDDGVPADIVAARNLAARTGGYVPAGTAPVKRRRWWQSR